MRVYTTFFIFVCSFALLQVNIIHKITSVKWNRKYEDTIFVLLQAVPADMDDVKKVLLKAYSIYREIDQIRDDEEDKLIDAVDKIPFSRLIESEPNGAVRLWVAFTSIE